MYIKTSKTLSAKYYQEYKEQLQRKACERYQNLSKVEKGCKRCKNLSEDEKEKLVEYRKKNYRMRKNAFL